MTSYVILGFYYVLCQFPSCEQVKWTTFVYTLNIQGEFKACGYFHNKKTEDSDYVHTLLTKAIDEYAALRTKAAEC